MKTYIFILLTGLLLFSGCKQVVYWKYGMHDPGEETCQSLIGFLNSMKQPLDRQYYFRDSASYLKFIWSPFYKKHILTTILFSDRGRLDRLVDSTRCQWSGYNYIMKLRSDSLFSSDTNIRYQAILKDIVPLDGNSLPDTVRYDFTVLVTWGKFLGKYNERLFINDLAVKENKRARIRLVYVNIDMQKCWNLTGEQKLVMK
jgi:hypothetical protein